MIEHHDLSYPVYRKVKEMILHQELKPGEKLLQEKLAQELGVSRTPLLKALQMLEHDYLVESIPRRGMYVKTFSIQEMMDIYDVREGIERVAVRLSAERMNENELKKLKAIWQPFIGKDKIDAKAYQLADEKFHSLIMEYSRNQFLSKTYNSSMIAGKVIQMGLQRTPEETLDEHLKIIEAIENKDLEQAEHWMKINICKSKEQIASNYQKQQS